jgi:hypothetical protein
MVDTNFRERQLPEVRIGPTEVSSGTVPMEFRTAFRTWAEKIRLHDAAWGAGLSAKSYAFKLRLEQK